MNCKLKPHSQKHINLKLAKMLVDTYPSPKVNKWLLMHQLWLHEEMKCHPTSLKRFNLMWILSLSEVPYPSCCPTKGCYPGAFAMWLLWSYTLCNNLKIFCPSKLLRLKSCNSRLACKWHFTTLSTSMKKSRWKCESNPVSWTFSSSQTITTNCEVITKWHDVFLAWNPEE